MDKELKAKWVAALRSGEYEQGKYYLRNTNNSYCCLGVLCVVAGHEPDDWESAYGACETDNPTRVDNKFVTREVAECLAEMNDGQCADGMQRSFAQIADYIEREL